VRSDSTITFYGAVITVNDIHDALVLYYQNKPTTVVKFIKSDYIMHELYNYAVLNADTVDTLLCYPSNNFTIKYTYKNLTGTIANIPKSLNTTIPKMVSLLMNRSANINEINTIYDTLNIDEFSENVQIKPYLRDSNKIPYYTYVCECSKLAKLNIWNQLKDAASEYFGEERSPSHAIFEVNITNNILVQYFMIFKQDF
jgi:hypothetical protein